MLCNKPTMASKGSGNDRAMKEVDDLLRYKQYPDGVSKGDKANVRKRAAKFVINDDILYYIDQTNGVMREVSTII